MLSTNESALELQVLEQKQAELVELNGSAVSPVVANVLKEVNRKFARHSFQLHGRMSDSGEKVNLRQETKLTCFRFALKTSKLVSTFDQKMVWQDNTA